MIMPEDFKSRVYSAVKRVSSGRVTTYKEIAKYLNCHAYRAVGKAMASNPYAPYIPCHRVVMANGNIGGYSGKGGVKKKIELLKSESVRVRKGKICNFENIFFRLS